jgi:predicted nucleic acid-binding protein
LRKFRDFATGGSPTHPQPITAPVPQDHSDTPFIQAAVDGHADVLVSGDAHLLALDGVYSFPIVAPGRFVEEHPGP